MDCRHSVIDAYALCSIAYSVICIGTIQFCWFFMLVSICCATKTMTIFSCVDSTCWCSFCGSVQRTSFQPKFCQIFARWLVRAVQGCIFCKLRRSMASSSETTLYNIKKLDGSNFRFWKKQIWHVLVQKKQVHPSS